LEEIPVLEEGEGPEMLKGGMVRQEELEIPPVPINSRNR
jgi:hypothetical protein